MWLWRTDSNPDVQDSWIAFAFCIHGQGIIQGKIDMDINLDIDMDRENSFSFSFQC